jgi:hypothetical protein
MLAEDHGDELHHHVLRSREIFCSRMPLRRSAKNDTDEDLIFVAASMVAMKKKIQARSVQIEGEADELY